MDEDVVEWAPSNFLPFEAELRVGLSQIENFGHDRPGRRA